LQALRQLRDERLYARQDVLVHAVDQMRRCDHGLDAAFDEAAAERDRLLPVARAVVDAGQDVAVDIDHAARLLER
jgi:hypothetical protein